MPRLAGADQGAGLLVAVGVSQFAGSTILTATNGADWSGQLVGIFDQLAGVAYGNGLFVIAGGDTNSGSVILSSTNAADWTIQPTSLTNPLDAIALRRWSVSSPSVTPVPSRFPPNASDRSSAQLGVARTATGITLCQFDSFVAVGEGANVVVSTNRSKLGGLLRAAPPSFLSGVAFGRGAFIAVGAGVSTILRSPNGLELATAKRQA